MESVFLYCIITAVAIVVALALAFRLTRIGNSLMKTLFKLGPYIAILLAIIAVFIFIMEDAREAYGLGNFFSVAGITLVAMILIGHTISIVRRSILEPKIKAAGKKGEKVRLGSPSLAVICLLDSLSMVMAGITLGANFCVNAGTGFIIAVTLFFFLMLQRLISIERLEKKTTRNSANANLFISLCVLLGATIISYVVISPDNLLSLTAISVAAGYLIYLALWQFYFLAKSAKK